MRKLVTKVTSKREYKYGMFFFMYLAYAMIFAAALIFLAPNVIQEWFSVYLTTDAHKFAFIVGAPVVFAAATLTFVINAKSTTGITNPWGK